MSKTPLLSDTGARISASFGEAHYLFEHMAPPEWLIAALPSAREAFDAWQAVNAEGAPIRKAWRASGAALVELRQSKPLAADLERAEREHQEAERQLDTATRKAKAALLRFDAIIRDAGSLAIEERRALAAAFALEKNREALAAWSTLREALDARDEALRHAGPAGVPWERRAAAGQSGDQQRALNHLGARVEGVDVRALEAIAAGEASGTPEQRAIAYGERGAERLGFDPSAGRSVGGSAPAGVPGLIGGHQ